jgi:hypothetical protein
VSNQPKSKRILPTSFTGHKGVLLIDSVVTNIGWLFTPTLAHTDGGVDGFIEIRRNETDELTNLILQVQSKATSKEWTAETEDSFEYRCAERDLTYWLQGNTPVILIVSRPDTDEAYWISVKDYFKDLSARKAKKIRFDKKKNRFDANAASTLHDLAARVDSGLYSEPPPKCETLISNLLQLSHYPKHLYLASTDYRDPANLDAYFRERRLHPGHEWCLKNERILSFHNLTEDPWPKVVDAGTAEQFPSDEWANADDVERRRDFVRLLNQALRSFLIARGVRRFAPKESAPIYYFAPGQDKVERRESWVGDAKDSDRFVVKAIHAQKEPERVVCYRHQAMQPRFDRFAGKWHLVIEPTYHFTRDGEIPSGYREEYLSGLKRIEKNQAVSNNVRFWEAFLTRQDLFLKRSESLAFDRVLRFETDFGIPEEAWYAKADTEEIERLSVTDVDVQLALL